MVDNMVYTNGVFINCAPVLRMNLTVLYRMLWAGSCPGSSVPAMPSLGRRSAHD